jgi:hypothetical protein
MISFSDVGKLMHLPLADIQSEELVEAPAFVINAAAEALLKANGRNWIPLIVKQVGKYEYQVTSNTFIYAVAHEAGLDRIWCIITDDSAETISLTKVLAREESPKVNLSNATREAIQDALKYLIERPGSSLSKVDLLVATNVIDTAERRFWKDFSPIAKLKCGITAGKKLDALSEIFYLEPIEPPLPPKPISIRTSLKSDILAQLKYLSEQKIGGFEKIDIEKAAQAIFDLDKTKWKKSLNPIVDLKCGIIKSQIKNLKPLLLL